MRSGVHCATIGAVNTIIERLAAEQSGDVPVLVTGGGGELVAGEIKAAAEFVPALTLEGLAILVEKARA